MLEALADRQSPQLCSILFVKRLLYSVNVVILPPSPSYEVMMCDEKCHLSSAHQDGDDDDADDKERNMKYQKKKHAHH